MILMVWEYHQTSGLYVPLNRLKEVGVGRLIDMGSDTLK